MQQTKIADLKLKMKVFFKGISKHTKQLLPFWKIFWLQDCLYLDN